MDRRRNAIYEFRLDAMLEDSNGEISPCVAKCVLVSRSIYFNVLAACDSSPCVYYLA